MAEIGHPTGNIGIAVPGPELPIICLMNETQVLTVSFWTVQGRFVGDHCPNPRKMPMLLSGSAI